MVLLCARTYTPLYVFPLYVVFYLLLLTLIQRNSFIAWFPTAIFELKLEPLAAWQHLLSILQWPRALLLAVCAGCVSRDMVRGHWVRSVPRFLSSFCGLDNGKHLESWRQLVRAAHGLTKWPSLWSPLIPGILPGKVESLRAPLLFLTSVLLFWSLKKKLQIFKWCKHLMT